MVKTPNAWENSILNIRKNDLKNVKTFEKSPSLLRNIENPRVTRRTMRAGTIRQN